MKTVPVKLGSRSYQVEISAGLSSDLGSLSRAALGDRSKRAVVVSNETIGSLLGTRVEKSLARADFKVDRFWMGDGERFKNLRTAESLLTFLIERRVERTDVIVALGGGVIGDLAGFVAATYLRGIRLVQVPTTLLAQIDSSVGGKTAVNHALGKNLIGAFHQPSLVVIDPEVLGSLSPRQFKAGLYEAIKYGVIRDRRLFNRVTRNVELLKKLDPIELEHLIARCCAIKAMVVARDEREGGLRRILNFGHTVGHALEAVTNYRRFRHGEAIAYGMLAAADLSVVRGALAERERQALAHLIAQLGPLPPIGDLSIAEVLEAVKRDKKVVHGTLHFVIAIEIGATMTVDDVTEAELREVLGRIGL